MPRATLILYREADGTVPLLDWLDEIAAKARANCRVRLERLAQMGYELRRPEADYLQDGIYESRWKHMGVNYRMLSFFHGTNAVVVSHGLTKQKAQVPRREIELAIRRMKAHETDPALHTHEEEV